MSDLPPCPECNSFYTYHDGTMLNCPECGHAWNDNNDESRIKMWRDSNGNELKDGDTVTVIKDLKFRGGVVKVGTKVKNIKLVDGDHDINCKIPGVGQMGLKTQFVKKVD